MGTILRKVETDKSITYYSAGPSSGPAGVGVGNGSVRNPGVKDMRHSIGTAPGTSGGPTREELEKEVPRDRKVESTDRVIHRR